MQSNAAATVVTGARRVGSPLKDASNWNRPAYDESTTRQLHFAYLPVIPVDPAARGTAALLQRWLQDRSASKASARPVPGLRVAAGVLTKADRFFLAHAASALQNLQSMGIAGRTVINLSIAGLSDPLLPIYVVSQLQRRGVSMVGVTVVLARYCPGRTEATTTRRPARGYSR